LRRAFQQESVRFLKRCARRARFLTYTAVPFPSTALTKLATTTNAQQSEGILNDKDQAGVQPVVGSTHPGFGRETV
jgi:hypothetical protein